MKVSVIVPTRDRAGLLARCLDSLVAQTLPADQFEVVVVDNGSTDDTRSVAKSYGDKLRLQYLYAAEPGLHVGRHAGMQSASSPILVFCDDDIEAVPTWLEAVAHAFETEGIALVGGNCYPRFEVQPPAWLERWWSEEGVSGRALGYLSILDFGEGRFSIDPCHVWGCNFAIRRDLLVAIGGFHPDGMPADRLPYRGDGESYVAAAIHAKGGQVWFDSRASVRHFVPRGRMTPGYFEQRAFAQGISESYRMIRRRGGLRVPLRERLSITMRARLSRAWYRLRSLVAADAAERELARVRSRAAAAFVRGIQFHRQRVRADQALLQWVLKENYLT
jgi:glycosyltransferase involved in cell wall biosynthesis